MSSHHFRLATFNLRNLALPNTPFYREIYSPEIYRRKTTWIAHQLQRMKADIVGFQEVFHAEALQETLAESRLYSHAKLIVSKHVEDGPAVALVSNFPVLSYQIFEQFPAAAKLDVQGVVLPFDRFSRPILSVKIAVHGVECVVFVVHLKSKRPILPEGVDRHDPIERAKGQARSLILRAAESTALRTLLMQTLQNQDYPVIVMGDVNDSALAVTTQMIEGEPPHRELSGDRKREIWDVLLYNVKDIQARRSYGDFFYTHIHNAHYETLDHILVSQEFVSGNSRRIGQVGNVSVLNDHLIDQALSDDEIPVWESDHGQVVVALELDR